MSVLFHAGPFRLHSGGVSGFKIDCDALTAEDWEVLALLAVDLLPSFGAVEGVPRGGLAFAAALRAYATSGPLLIADDVLTTGGSMEAHRGAREALGIVAFHRDCRQRPSWINAVWQLGAPFDEAAGSAFEPRRLW